MKTKSVYEKIPFDDVRHPVRILPDMSAPKEEPHSHLLTWHEQLEILYFHRGGAEVQYGVTRETARDGDIFIVNSLQGHAVRHYTGEPLYDCLMIDPYIYADLLRELCLRTRGKPLSDSHVCFNNRIGETARPAALLDAVMEEFAAGGPAADLAIERYIQNLIIVLFLTEFKEFRPLRDDERNVFRYRRLEPVLRYVEEHYAEAITLDKLADLCAVTKTHFCRLFKAAVGQTATEYIHLIRLSKAERLLRTTDLGIAEIARRSGYDDNAYFSRRFRRQYGFPPTALRP